LLITVIVFDADGRRADELSLVVAAMSPLRVDTRLSLLPRWLRQTLFLHVFHVRIWTSISLHTDAYTATAHQYLAPNTIVF